MTHFANVSNDRSYYDPDIYWPSSRDRRAKQRTVPVSTQRSQVQVRQIAIQTLSNLMSEFKSQGHISSTGRSHVVNCQFRTDPAQASRSVPWVHIFSGILWVKWPVPTQQESTCSRVLWTRDVYSHTHPRVRTISSFDARIVCFPWHFSFYPIRARVLTTW